MDFHPRLSMLLASCINPQQQKLRLAGERAGASTPRCPRCALLAGMPRWMMSGALHARWLGRAEHLPAASAAPSAQLPDSLNAWLQATLAASQTGLGPRACCSATTW